jgi:hypothetical protein
MPEPLSPKSQTMVLRWKKMMIAAINDRNTATSWVIPIWGRTK